MFRDTIEAGLIPDDKTKAAYNSRKLQEYREQCNRIHWRHIGPEPNCNYYLSEPVTLRSSEVWTGDGMQTRAIFEIDSGSALSLGLFCSVRSMTISAKCDRTVDAARASRWKLDGIGITGGSKVGLYMDNNWIFHVSDCYISRHDVGVFLHGGTQMLAGKFQGGEIHSNRIGVHLLGNTHDCTFDCVTIEANKEGAIVMDGPNAKRNTTIGGCYFESNGEQPAVRIGGASWGTKLLNCGFHDKNTGWEITGGFGAVVSGNHHQVFSESNGKIGRKATRTLVTLGTAGPNKCRIENIVNESDSTIYA